MRRRGDSVRTRTAAHQDIPTDDFVWDLSRALEHERPVPERVARVPEAIRKAAGGIPVSTTDGTSLCCTKHGGFGVPGGV